MKNKAISEQTRTLFFTTSPRTPKKIIPEISLLVERYHGQKWDKTTQTCFMKELSSQPFFGQVKPTKNFDLSARDRINRAPKLLGFVDLETTIKPTDPFKQILSNKRIEECFLRQLLKFQLPSPFKPLSQRNKTSFWVRPYLEILRLIKECDYLSRDEMAIFGMQLTDYHNFEVIVQKIKDFRQKKNERNGITYDCFIDQIAYSELEVIYKDLIEQDVLSKRENDGKKISASDFIATKKRNMYDYADACRRYLQITGLIKIDMRHRSVTISSTRYDDVNWLLNNINRNPVFVDNLEEYQTYLYDTTAPKIYSDDRQTIIMSLNKYGFTSEELSKNTIDELKDKYEVAIKKNVEEAVSFEQMSLKDYSDFNDIENVFNSLINDRRMPDRPLMLEWNTWRAMTMLNHGYIEGNFTRDMNGNPEETAGSGLPDIVCHYESFDLIVEVTMQTGRRQYNSEGEPVADHVGQHRCKTGKPTYCIFLAPTINDNVTAYFYAINKMPMQTYGGVSQIVPMSIGLFNSFIGRAKTATVKPNDKDIKYFLDLSLNALSSCDNEKEWYNTIVSNATRWMSNASA